MRIVIVSVLFAFYLVNNSRTEDDAGWNAATGKTADPVTHSKLPEVGVDGLFATNEPERGEEGGQFLHVPKNLVRGLKEAMEVARQKQETLIAHLECSLSRTPRCEERVEEAAPVKLDWTTYMADDQMPFLLEISHFFRKNPVELPIEIIAPIMQMFDGAVTELYIKQRYISNLFDQTVCSINPTCDKSKVPGRRTSFTERDGELGFQDRLFPFLSQWLAGIFRPVAPFYPVFIPPTIFAGQKPCRNETLSGTFNNGTGYYYSTLVQYGTNCNKVEHTSNKAHP